MKKILFLLSIILNICSCERTDKVISEHSFQIENKTEGKIEVIFIAKANAALSDYRDGIGKKIVIEKNGVVEVFYMSGHEGNAPHYYSTAFLIADGKEYKYTDKVSRKSILSTEAYLRISDINNKKGIQITTNKLTIDNKFLNL